MQAASTDKGDSVQGNNLGKLLVEACRLPNDAGGKEESDFFIVTENVINSLSNTDQVKAADDESKKELSDTQQVLAHSEQVKTMRKNRQDVMKKQHPFEQMLTEEREKMAKIDAERDKFARESRKRDKKIVELNNEIQKLRNQLESVDGLKNSGQILFRMTNFKAFSEGNGPAETVYSEPVEHINGVPWQIGVFYTKDWIGVFLKCIGDLNDKSWHCQASFKLSVVSSCTESEEQFMQNYNHVFTANNDEWDLKTFAKIEALMDAKNGFYVKEEDAITFKAELLTTKPKGMARSELSTKHPLLVNMKLVHVNKYLLAAHSEMFQRLFFGANAVATPQLYAYDGYVDDVSHFERLISTMYPLNLALDDECVAGVLSLAHQFQLDSVVKHCVDFLLTKSKKSAFVKFRLAHKCGIVGMKEKILADMTKDDFAFAGENFMDNLSEINNLAFEFEAMKELRGRHSQLFGNTK